MLNPLSTNWLPNPPTLQKAIAAGHVGVIDSPRGRLYVVAKDCPNAEPVTRAITLRNRLELAWAAVVAGVAVGGMFCVAHLFNMV